MRTVRRQDTCLSIGFIFLFLVNPTAPVCIQTEPPKVQSNLRLFGLLFRVSANPRSHHFSLQWSQQPAENKNNQRYEKQNQKNGKNRLRHWQTREFRSELVQSFPTFAPISLHPKSSRPIQVLVMLLDNLLKPTRKPLVRLGFLFQNLAREHHMILVLFHHLCHALVGR